VAGVLEQGACSSGWGRLIFHVKDVDELWAYLKAKALDAPRPRDASWGERYFHLQDPDGHELSFAMPTVPTGELWELSQDFVDCATLRRRPDLVQDLDQPVRNAAEPLKDLGAFLVFIPLAWSVDHSVHFFVVLAWSVDHSVPFFISLTWPIDHSVRCVGF
jgi:hypothetical protein